MHSHHFLLANGTEINTLSVFYYYGKLELLSVLYVSLALSAQYQLFKRTLRLFRVTFETQHSLYFVDVAIKTVSGVSVHNNLALSVDYEFGEVPGDILNLTSFTVVKAVCLFPKRFKHWVSFLAVYVALLHDWKLRAHFLPRKSYDFFTRAMLLAQKLVTWKRDYL